MSFNYTASAATATRLLQKFGASATLTQQTAGAYDPATSSATVTETANTVTAVVLDLPAKYIDGTLILQGDKQALLTPAVAPKQGDVLTWQGVDYTFVQVKPVAPAGVAVLYDCIVRGP